MSSTLGAAQLEQWLRRLTENGISYINLDEAAHSVELYDAILEIRNDGTWKCQQAQHSRSERRSSGRWNPDRMTTLR